MLISKNNKDSLNENTNVAFERRKHEYKKRKD